MEILYGQFRGIIFAFTQAIRDCGQVWSTFMRCFDECFTQGRIFSSQNNARMHALKAAFSSRSRVTARDEIRTITANCCAFVTSHHWHAAVCQRRSLLLQQSMRKITFWSSRSKQVQFHRMITKWLSDDLILTWHYLKPYNDTTSSDTSEPG